MWIAFWGGGTVRRERTTLPADGVVSSMKYSRRAVCTPGDWTAKTRRSGTGIVLCCFLSETKKIPPSLERLCTWS